MKRWALSSALLWTLSTSALAGALTAALCAFAACATAATPGDTYPMKIPAPGGEVILPDAYSKEAYDQYRYAAARRVDNTLYVSGVIVGRRENEGRDV